MPKRAGSSSTRQAQPSPASSVWWHFNRLSAKRGDGDVWTIRKGGKNYFVRKVRYGKLESVFRGAKAQQPRAYIKGKVRVKIKGGVATLYDA